jgi:hypothetical protein
MKGFCDECEGNQREGHMPWCSLDSAKQHDILNPPPAFESTWVAITNAGRKLRFTMGPSVTAQFALNYAQTHPATFGLDSVPETIIDVEKVK